MTSKRFEVDMGLNATQFARGAKDAEGALDKLAAALNEVGEDGKRDAGEVESALEDLFRQAQRTERAVDDMGAVGGRGLGKLKESATEVQQEIGQNLGEAVSSFRGDLSDLAQVGQDTLGGLAATMAGTGPAGIAGAALLAAGAIGAGGIAAALEQAEERRRVLAERANDLAQAYIDAGSGVLDALTQVDRFVEVLTDPEMRKEAEGLAKLVGDDLPLAARVLAGDEEALADARTHQTALMKDQSIAGVALKNALDEQTQVQRQAKETAALVTDEYLRQINAAQGVTQEVDALGNSVYTLPDGKQIMIDAATGQASADVSRFKGDLDGVAEKVIQPVIRPRIDTSEWDGWEPQLKRGYVDATVLRNGMSLQ